MLLTPLQPDLFERLMGEHDEYQPLITKFRPPVSGQILQVRTRLLALLRRALFHPLTLISAPPGSGKTTLLSQWIQSLANEHISAAWVSLDVNDNEPLRFWNVLLTALAQKVPAFDSLQRNKGMESISTLLMLLINTCIVQQEPIVLILDDYHTITEGAIQKQMAYFIEHLPPHMHVVLSTRVDPYLPLARLRVRRQMLEVLRHDLRFTNEEATFFLREVMHLSLTADEITDLVNRVDGWIAGLCLTGHALYKSHAAEALSTSARDGQRYIFDYMLEEVLLAQEEHIQTFLLRTACLTHFSASLCDAVLDRQDSWQILQQIERANLFLIPEDHEHTWYHYQTLFADALRSRLEQIESEMLPLLHRRASYWYEQHGMLVDVIEPPQEKKVYKELQVQQAFSSQQVVDPLSIREIEVLRFMARGDSNREIANSLIIAPTTVKRHVSNILSKLQASNRTQAVACGRQFGLLQ